MHQTLVNDQKMRWGVRMYICPTVDGFRGTPRPLLVNPPQSALWPCMWDGGTDPNSACWAPLQSSCLMHMGKRTGVAVSHRISWFQTQLIPTACQIRYHSHLWDHRSTGQL